MRRLCWGYFFSVLLCSSAFAEMQKMDASVTREEGLLIRSEDINQDGTPDHWWHSLRGGEVLKIERDLDYDGNPDTRQWTFLRNKTPGKFEKMLYEDRLLGKIVRIDYFDNVGFLERIELATSGKEMVNVVIECHGRILDKIQADFHDYGVPDLVITFDNGSFVKAESPAGTAGGVNLADMAAVKKWWQESAPNQYQKYTALLKRFKQVE